MRSVLLAVCLSDLDFEVLGKHFPRVLILRDGRGYRCHRVVPDRAGRRLGQALDC